MGNKIDVVTELEKLETKVTEARNDLSKLKDGLPQGFDCPKCGHKTLAMRRGIVAWGLGCAPVHLTMNGKFIDIWGEVMTCYNCGTHFQKTDKTVYEEIKE